MNNKIKNVAVSVCFCLFIAFFVVMCAVKFFSPTETSEAERRPLAQFPTEISVEGVFDKTVINGFEDYSVDQFPFREFFRTVKALFQTKVLNLKENNGLAEKNGYIAKIEPEFTDGLTDYSIGRLQFVYDKFIKDNGGKSFVCLIPDKNYFFAKDFSYPSPDYSALALKVQSMLPDMEYIDIFDTLSLSDYYRTDTHWSQDKILPVAEKIASHLGVDSYLSDDYTLNSLEGFAGVYYGQSALHPKKDTLVYLTDETLDKCTVFDYETGKTGPVYDVDKFGGTDGYDIFLSGTRALLRLDSPDAKSDKELIVFRDSFGSSLIPLLAGAYRSIYIVDIRYVMPEMVGNFIDFSDKDVLYLYSSLILNQKAFK